MNAPKVINKNNIENKFFNSLICCLILLFIPNISYSQEWIHLSKNRNFTSVFEQGDDIWIGGYHGLVQYHRNSDTYEYYDDVSSVLREKMIKNLTGSETELYIQTWDGMIYTFVNNEIVPMDMINNYLNGINSEGVMLNNFNGDLWFITFNGIIQYKDGEFILHTPDPTIFSGYYYQTLFSDSQGRVWTAENNAIYCFDGVNWERLNQENIEGFNEDSEHRIWMHTYGKIISYDGISFETFTSPAIDITSCFIAPDDKLWMSINYADFYTDNSRVGLFQSFDTHSKSWTQYDTTDIPFKNKHFEVILPCADNEIYMAGYFGLEKTDLFNSTYLGSISNSDIPEDFIISISPDSKGNIYFSCLGEFLADPTSVPMIVKYDWTTFEELVSSDTFEYIFFTPDPVTDKLIIADNNSIYYFEDHNLSKIADLPDEFASDVYTLYIDHNGRIWLKDFLLNYPGISSNKLFYYDNTWIEVDISSIDPLWDAFEDIFFDWKNDPILLVNNELYRIEMESGNIDCITDDELGDEYSPIKTISDLPGQKLFGSVYSLNLVSIGIYEDDNWEVTPDTAIGFSGWSPFLLQLDNGNIWGCGTGGNYVLSKYGEDVKRIEKYNLQSNIELWDFKADKNGNLFIATNNAGLYIYNENGINPSSVMYSGQNASFMAGLNPSGSILTIFNHNFLGNTINISVVNLEGKVIYQAQHAISEVIYIPLELISHGIYLVHVENEQMNYGTVKFYK